MFVFPLVFIIWTRGVRVKDIIIPENSKATKINILLISVAIAENKAFQAIPFTVLYQKMLKLLPKLPVFDLRPHSKRI